MKTTSTIHDGLASANKHLEPTCPMHVIAYVPLKSLQYMHSTSNQNNQSGNSENEQFIKAVNVLLCTVQCSSYRSPHT